MSNARQRIAALSPEKRQVLLQQLKSKQEGLRQTEIKRRDPNISRFPVSYPQQQLWFVDQLEPNNPSYNMAKAIRLRGKLDLAILRRTFSEIVRRQTASPDEHRRRGLPL